MTLFGEREQARERLVRQVGCPVCLAAAGKACRYETWDGKHVLPQSASHTGRYKVAAEQGLVPPLPKVSA